MLMCGLCGLSGLSRRWLMTKPVVKFEEMTKEELIEYIKELQGEQTQASFASSIECSAAYLSDICAGRRDPGPKVLEALGLKRCVTYKKWRSDDKQ
jgi:hypothetical protein